MIDKFNIFLEKANKIHSSFYSYNIICPKHGLFKQIPNNHLQGRGCPKCKQSIGEKRVENYLIKMSIKYESQKKFSNCKNILPLSFDFWLPDYNTLIEFDGIQHYKPVGYMNGQEKLAYTIKCDKIKSEYCKENNIHLIRISYKDLNKIENILDKLL